MIPFRANHRREDFPGISAQTLSQLDGMWQSSSSLIQSFLSIREMTQNQPPATNIKLVIHADRRPSNEHERRYNSPASPKIAAIAVGTGENYIHRNDIVLHRRGQLNDNGNEKF